MKSRRDSGRMACAAIAAVSTLAGVGSAWWPCGQTLKLTAEDGEAGDRLGRSVAFDGVFALVGADGDNDEGLNSGSVYIFDPATGQQLFKLTADDAGERDRFGNAVAMSGTIAIIGAYGDDDLAEDSGAAYLFDVLTGEQIAKIKADDAEEDDGFGHVVAISGNLAVLGASWSDEESGAAYVFDVTDPANPIQIRKLTPEDGDPGDEFGCSVAIGGGIAVVGALWDDDAGEDSGSAYVFDATTGQQLHKLKAGDASADDGFGCSVAIDGNVLAVGMYCDDGDEGESNVGAAYVFDVTTGEQLHKLTADDPWPSAHLGFSVALSGWKAVAGAVWDQEGGEHAGAAYVFDVMTGEQLAKLISDDIEEEDHLGASVAIKGDVVVVGALYDDDAGAGSGSAYVFECENMCPADFDGDDDVNTADLLVLLGEWGTNGSEGGDVDGDGDVDAADLLALLAAWGDCPRPPCPWDFNGDDIVDDLDQEILWEHFGPCPDPPEECPWDLDGDGDVDYADVGVLLEHYGPCP